MFIYNHRIIWPIIDRLSELIINAAFLPGEVRLMSLSDELRLEGKYSNSYYNADGVLLNIKHNSEIITLETTGPFHLIKQFKRGGKLY